MTKRILLWGFILYLPRVEHSIEIGENQLKNHCRGGISPTFMPCAIRVEIVFVPGLLYHGFKVYFGRRYLRFSKQTRHILFKDRFRIFPGMLTLQSFI